MREKVEQGGVGSGLLGARLEGAPVSLEAEALYIRNSVAAPDLDAAFGTPLSMQTRTRAALVNLKLAPRKSMRAAGLSVRPYIAGGLGYGESALTILGDDYKGRGGMGQGKVGLELQASHRLTFDLGYRYLKLPSFHTNHLGLDARLRTDVQAVTLGAAWTFGVR